MYLRTDAELDWMEWSFFLEMLSVERTEPFLHELAIPFEQEHFPNVMRLARACLEVHMSPTVSVAKENPEFPGLAKAWERYRKAEGVLSDTAIQRFLERYGSLESASQGVYSQLQGWAGANTKDGLKEWFVNSYRSSPDAVWQWPWALRLLFTDDSLKVTPTTLAPITKDEQQYVKSFCIRYAAKQRDLEKRFWVISQAATATLPTLWESVLQTFPAGGLGNRYPWLIHVEQCLQLRLIRKEWSRLKAELGSSVMEQLTTWVKQQEALLPYSTTLMDEPSPL